MDGLIQRIAGQQLSSNSRLENAGSTATHHGSAEEEEEVAWVQNAYGRYDDNDGGNGDGDGDGDDGEDWICVFADVKEQTLHRRDGKDDDDYGGDGDADGDGDGNSVNDI